jgi:putative transposase
MVEIIFSRNCVYQFAYHVVWCPKYRQKVLIGKIATGVSDMIDEICKDNEWPLIAKEVQPDHIHLFLSISPSLSVANAIKILKGTTARKLFLQFPELKEKLWDGHLWSPSYYAGTAGNVSAETIKKYIERVEHIGGRR